MTIEENPGYGTDLKYTEQKGALKRENTKKVNYYFIMMNSLDKNICDFYYLAAPLNKKGLVILSYHRRLGVPLHMQGIW